MSFARIGAWVALAALGAPVLADRVFAEGAAPRQGVVVELFTSQGCSACPAADAYLAEMTERPGVIALSLHVDYWDYIGWADSFGQARFTERQKAYARAGGSRAIYTPQMVVAGGARVAGLDPVAVETAVAAERPSVLVQLQRQGDRLQIGAPALSHPVPVAVQLVRYAPRVQVMIEAGENAGRLVDYTNVVTSWTRLADWDGGVPLALQADVPGGEGIAVILQEMTVKGLPARILGAAALD